ncbi:MAG: hypothetical protein CVU03_05795 [Bacteroidetes bacterium HGW-Bacteroidetes-2]|jgi:hypothetical protein|nr:MAG: hypothetical protein CVU03_05795 [Bacteroidetes bacterium HGW-Bacteroidetes-2]
MKTRANYFTKQGLSLGGNIHFESDSFTFNTHLLNFKKETLKVQYKNILSIELEVIIGPMLRIVLKNGETLAFVVSNRKKIKEFLEQKIKINS